jgi:hypothetical protein
VTDQLFYASHNYSTTKTWFSGSGRRQLALPKITAIVGVMEYWNIDNRGEFRSIEYLKYSIVNSQYSFPAQPGWGVIFGFT